MFAPWLTQTIRLYENLPYAEFEWIVGPIPIDDQNVSGILSEDKRFVTVLMCFQGKEIITRFSTNISSNGYTYTDSNGREMQERLFNYRPTWNLTVHEPVAGK